VSRGASLAHAMAPSTSLGNTRRSGKKRLALAITRSSKLMMGCPSAVTTALRRMRSPCGLADASCAKRMQSRTVGSRVAKRTSLMMASTSRSSSASLITSR
jgi:hypothetical protein